MSGRRPSRWDRQQPDHIEPYEDEYDQHDYHAFSPGMGATPRWQYPPQVSPPPALAQHVTPWAQGMTSQQESTYHDPQRQQYFDPSGSLYDQEHQAGIDQHGYYLGSQQQWDLSDSQRRQGFGSDTDHLGRTSDMPDQAASSHAYPAVDPAFELDYMYESPVDVDDEYVQASRRSHVEDDEASNRANAGSFSRHDELHRIERWEDEQPHFPEPESGSTQHRQRGPERRHMHPRNSKKTRSKKAKDSIRSFDEKFDGGKGGSSPSSGHRSKG